MEREKEDLSELLKNIISDVREKNQRPGPGAVPRSDEFFGELAKKYGLVPFTVPTLIRMLVSSSCLLGFTLIEEERKKKILRVEGYVVTEPGVIDPLIRYYSRELESIYMINYNKKAAYNKIIQEISPDLHVHNGTPLGICTSTLIMLSTVSDMLQWEPMKYSRKSKDRLLETEIAGGRPPSYFFASDSAGNGRETVQEKTAQRPDPGPSIVRYADIRKHTDSNTIQKSLAVYGVEFYTRVCFREYQFALIYRIIQDGIITEKKDLSVIRELIARERTRADKDLRIQGFAGDINALEKLINERLQGA